MNPVGGDSEKSGSQGLKVSSVRVYPIKSFGGVEMDAARFSARGFELDRRWMLADRNGRFLSQRDFPPLALMRVAPQSDSLKVTEPHGVSIDIPFIPDGEGSIEVSVWDDTASGRTYSSAVDEFFSDYIGSDCRLVKIDDAVPRPVEESFRVHPEDEVSFADGFPFLIIGESSLADLNARLESNVAMDRFRPNIIFSGGEPFAEDGWARVRIGGHEFHIVKPCARCVMTTIDQETGAKGAEPLATLAKFRMHSASGKRKILFGQNAIASGASGIVQVGDAIELLESKPMPTFD
ncbi:MAG: MOSC domain-containing protein [Acidobacteriota bacterium]